MTNCNDQIVHLSDPQTITEDSENRITSVGHSHEIEKASQTTAGIVKVVDHTESTDPLEALSANQGRLLAEALREVVHYNKDETINQTLDAALGYLSNRLTGSYSTLALAKANAYKHAEAALIYVVNDPEVSNCGLYTIQGGELVKAPWDALSSALTSEPFEVLHRIMTLPAGTTVEYQGNVYFSLATLGKAIADGQAEISEIIQTLANANGLLSRYILTDSGKTQEEVNTETRIKHAADLEYVNEQLALKAPQATTYTKIEVDSALSTKAPQASTYTKAEVDASLNSIAGGHKAYQTLVAAQTAQASLPVNSIVEVTNDGANNGTYQWNGTTLTKSAYDPLTQAKNYSDEKIYSLPDNGNVFEFTDSNGLTGVTIDNDGNINASNINSSNNFDDAAMVVIDKHGNVALAVDAEGNLQSSTIINLNRRVAAIEDGSIKPVLTTPNKKTDYMHVFSYGQSLSRGYGSKPVISTTQSYSNLTFASGVLPLLADAHDFTSFKPLVEEVFGAEGETPVSGMLNGFVARQVVKGDKASNWAMIGSSSGRGGYSVAQLSKGGAEYTGMIAQVQAAYDIAQAQGKSYSVWSIAWSQGETDYSLNTTKTAYTNSLLKLRDDFNADVKAVTGQLFSPIFIMYQVAAHKRYNKNEMTIALAQLELANNDPNFIMACPIYNLPHIADNLHLTADSSLQLGKYYAKALDYTIYAGEKWQPLKPISITRQGKVIDIEFNKSGLTIDTVLVTATHNMGFDLWSDGSLLDTITTVAVSDKNRVRLVLSSTPPDGTKISYGKGRVGDPLTGGNTTGARGNLRDNAGDYDNYVDSKGVTRYMHNFCVMFEQSI